MAMADRLLQTTKCSVFLMKEAIDVALRTLLGRSIYLCIWACYGNFLCLYHVTITDTTIVSESHKVLMSAKKSKYNFNWLSSNYTVYS